MFLNIFLCVLTGYHFEILMQTKGCLEGKSTYKWKTSFTWFQGLTEHLHSSFLGLLANTWPYCQAAAAKSLQSCLTLCDPIDGSPPGSPIPGILQARTLECMKVKSESEVLQLCPTLCDPMDCSSPGSSIHGILQVRVLEWVAISFSRGSSQPRDRTQVSRIPGRRFNLWAAREAL